MAQVWYRAEVQGKRKLTMQYPYRRNGYIYSKGTKQGFERMKRLGIPRPLFRIEDQLAGILRKHYKAFSRDLMQDIKRAAATGGMTIDNAPDSNSLDDLMSFFDDMAEQYRKEQDEIARRANAQALANTLQHEWFEEDQEELERLDDMYMGELDDNLRPVIEKTFAKEQGDYLGRLFSDADGRTQGILQSFSINKQKLFNDTMAGIRKNYVDNSLKRIMWEQDYIKRQILQRIIDYATNKADTLDLKDLTLAAYDSSDKRARFFARDQMARFNKAVTLGTFENAGVTKVKWVTAHDGRVRKSHKELDGVVFDIDALPIEVDDYNCRCGLIPVEWADD